ncbi:MAG: hypothetical protein H6563_05935 [Lewinellaceae bacterium]|nr:hypothetical protein [Lewinellaceae bacterium]
MDILKTPQKPGQEASVASYMPSDETLKAMYEAAKEDQIQRGRLDAIRSMTVSGSLIVISILLFLTHWFWMKRAAKVQTQ